MGFDFRALLDLAAILAVGVLAVFGLVAFAMPKGDRMRAIPRGRSRVTQADMDEANEMAWRNDQGIKAMAARVMGRGGR